jgi:hypothetical protein
MKVTRRRVLTLLLGVVVLFAGIWFARRFKEQLFAVPPRGGESFAMPALSTPHYRQRDPRWAEDSIGGFGEGMAHAGCTVCSLAMALNYYGVRKTPKELNDFLKANDGYNPRGWLRWNSVDKISGGQVTMAYLGRPSHAVIDQALKDRRPVLAKVYINGIIPHWVLIVGKDREEYLMRDPVGEQGTVGCVSDYTSKIYAVRILKAMPPDR